MGLESQLQGKKKPGRYEKLLACHVLLLRMIPDAGLITVDGMNQKLDELEPEIRKKLPEFSFGSWARGGVFNLLVFMHRCDLVTLLIDMKPVTRDDEKRGRVCRNEHTSRYLRAAEREAATALSQMGV